MIELHKTIFKIIFHTWEKDSASGFLGIYSSKVVNSAVQDS
jgi:hypothetical protein